MFYFHFDLPFQSLLKFPRRNDQKDYLIFERNITEHKVFELQISRWMTTDVFSMSVELGFFGADHAGPGLSLTIMGYGLIVGLKDNRHWSCTHHRWMTDQEMIDDFTL